MEVDAPPPKRRRTSPRQAHSSNGAADVRPTTEISGSMSNNNANANHTNRASAAANSKLPRPSFASPTRASLARNYPDLLGRRQSVPRDVTAADADANNDTNTNVHPLQQPPQRSPTRSPRRSVSPTRPPPLSLPPVRSPSRSPTRRRAPENGFLAVPPQQSPVAKRQRDMVTSTANDNNDNNDNRMPDAAESDGSVLHALPKRSPVKPVPRPLPPPDPQRQQDVLEPLIARDKRLRTAGLDAFRVAGDASAQAAEPELPPTPEHLRAKLLSPSGARASSENRSSPQHSTPTKRRKKTGRVGKLRSGAHAQAASSSPLQHTSTNEAHDGPGRAGSDGPDAESRAQTDDGHARKEPDVLDEPEPDEPETMTARVRKLVPVDEDADKKKDRDAVLAEIAGLEADLALAAAENARLRDAAEAKEDALPNATGATLPVAPNAREITSLLRRRALPDDDDNDDNKTDDPTAADWLQAATNPIAFLPFGRPQADLAGLLDMFGQAKADKETETDEPLPVSHHPVPMSAADELPFLQAFTPLAFTSHIFALAPVDGVARQRHVITATSTTPPGAFVARIEMTVNSTSLTITELAVPRIEPPQAARELQPLVRLVTKPASVSGSSALTHNVTVLAWALGEWVRVAVRRATLWAALAQLAADKGAGMAAAVAALRQKREPVAPKTPTKRMLLEHLGRTGMDLDLPFVFGDAAPSVGVRVEWDIAFDWAGEAASTTRLLVGLPGHWRKADRKGTLATLPRVFDRLLADGVAPLRAVQTAVALLAGDEPV